MVREAVWFALFWVGALVALVAFVFGNVGLAEAATGTSLVALFAALMLERKRRREREAPPK